MAALTSMNLAIEISKNADEEVKQFKLELARLMRKNIEETSRIMAIRAAERVHEEPVWYEPLKSITPTRRENRSVALEPMTEAQIDAALAKAADEMFNAFD